ncbi:MAG: hypothetical protein ACOYXU_10045 [Nitrospirota bacterium]
MTSDQAETRTSVGPRARGDAPDNVIAIVVVEKDRLAIDAARHDGSLP